MDFINGLNIAGLFLSLLFIMLILSKKNKSLKDYLLAFFIFLLGTFLFIKYIVRKDLTDSFPIVTYFDIYYWVLLGPTLYIYTMISTKGIKGWQSKHLLVFTPALIVTLCFAKYLFQNPANFFKEEPKLPVYVLIGYYVWLLNSVVFYILTIVRLKKHQKDIQQYYSFSEPVDLKWLYYLSNGFAVYLFFLIFRSISKNAFGLELPFGSYSISIFVMLIYIFGIGYFGYRQPGIFNNPDFQLSGSGLQEIKKNTNNNGKLYEKSGLEKQEAQRILISLESIMNSEEPYLKGDLDLTALADLIKVSPHKLSQALNVHLHKNFFDYINGYRIEKVKEYLSDDKKNHFKIESLAFDCGFYSKSTFYKIFKRNEGITPAEFRLKHQKETA